MISIYPKKKYPSFLSRQNAGSRSCRVSGSKGHEAMASRECHRMYRQDQALPLKWFTASSDATIQSFLSPSQRGIPLNRQQINVLFQAIHKYVNMYNVQRKYKSNICLFSSHSLSRWQTFIWESLRSYIRRSATTGISNTFIIAGAGSIRRTGLRLTGRWWTGHVHGRAPVIKREQVACCLSQTAEHQQFRFIQAEWEPAIHSRATLLRRSLHVFHINCSRVGGHSKG